MHSNVTKIMLSWPHMGHPVYERVHGESRITLYICYVQITIFCNRN